MAIFFLYLKNIGRTAGSSAVDAAAYRAGERLRDERTGRIHDHTGRGGVLHSEILLPARFDDADMAWARDRGTLWNAAEAAEQRKNARVAREYLVALPAELDPRRRVELARSFARDLADRHRFAVDLAVHAPREHVDSDPRNFHAHVLATTRELTLEGFGDKTALEWSDGRRAEFGLGSAIDEHWRIRESWAGLTNEALRAAGLDVRVDHRSLADQGVDRLPRPNIPKVAFEMERRGHYSPVAERVRAAHRADEERRRERVASAAVSAAVSASEESPVAQTAASGARAGAAAMLDDLRRRARENWLRFREAQATPEAIAKTRTRDDDLSR